MYCIQYFEMVYQIQCMTYNNTDNQIHLNELDIEPQPPKLDRHIANRIQPTQFSRNRQLTYRAITPLVYSETRSVESRFPYFNSQPIPLSLERDQTDDKYRQALRQKKKFKQQYHGINPLDKEIKVKVVMPKRPIGEYQTFDYDGTLIRKYQSQRQLTPIQTEPRTSQYKHSDKCKQVQVEQENIINQQALLKHQKQNKIKTHWDDEPNLNEFKLKKGVILYYNNTITAKQETLDITSNDDDLYQINPKKSIANQQQTAVQLKLFKLPPSKHLETIQTSPRNNKFIKFINNSIMRHVI